jgi:hypothetical protein
MFLQLQTRLTRVQYNSNLHPKAVELLHLSVGAVLEFVRPWMLLNIRYSRARSRFARYHWPRSQIAPQQILYIIILYSSYTGRSQLHKPKPPISSQHKFDYRDIFSSVMTELTVAPQTLVNTNTQREREVQQLLYI